MKEALMSLNKAIALNPDNTFYKAKQVELYWQMRLDKGALTAFPAVVALAEPLLSQPPGDLQIQEIFTVNLLRNLAKRAEFQPAIACLNADLKQKL